MAKREYVHLSLSERDIITTMLEIFVNGDRFVKGAKVIESEFKALMGVSLCQRDPLKLA
jgi:hypothetical protein